MNHIEAFRQAIEAAGIVPPKQIIDDGRRHRFSSSGKPKDDSGWYILHGDDRPAGAFGCWRQQINVNWKHDGERREFTQAERDAWKQRMQAIDAEREAERKAAIEKAAATAKEMWDAGEPAEQIDHPYLMRKQVIGYGARILRDLLLIPMRQGPAPLCGLQVIQPNGERKFLTGTPAGGAYTVIGKPTKTGTVVICEGYATGCSIHEATDWCVVIAFSASNIKPVADKIRAAMPTAKVIIAADDDRETKNNPGVTAAASTGLPFYVPQWKGERGKGTDFNDLHNDEGLDAVLKCFEKPGVSPSPEASNAGAVSDKPHVKPDSEAGSSFPGNTGSSAGRPPPRSGDAVQEPAIPAMKSGAGSDVTELVDYHSPLPNTTDKGKALVTIENVAEICRRLGVVVRYNVISKEEEILIPGAGFSLDNRQNASLAWLISECSKFHLRGDRVPDFLTYLADQNQFNPVANWILSKPWDGQDHLADLIDTVQAKGEADDHRIARMKRAFITRWMISAVAAAFRPNGVSAHGVLVFQGAQYVGKTKWFKSLVPEALGVLKDGMLLRPDDRDSVMKCVSNWLVELGEIDATFRKSDVAALKSFLTSDRDVLRKAYARKESAFARRTVFFASVNPKNYLHDETGNRRYWTIEVEHLDHSHGVNMQQCWAQVHMLWASGDSWFLEPEEMELLNEHNRDFEVVDPIEDLITNGLPWNTDPAGWKWVTPTEVLMALGRKNCTKAETTKAGIIIRRLNGDRCKRSKTSRLLLIPDTSVTPV